MLAEIKHVHQVPMAGILMGASVSAAVGGEPAQVLFAGLDSPGLYVVRIAIPSDLASGPQPIRVSAGGAQTRSSLVLTVNTVP
jgi:uncharacterized protein (TIGR03437 family)